MAKTGTQDRGFKSSWQKVVFIRNFLAQRIVKGADVYRMGSMFCCKQKHLHRSTFCCSTKKIQLPRSKTGLPDGLGIFKPKPHFWYILEGL
jgi:hypothetical protein